MDEEIIKGKCKGLKITRYSDDEIPESTVSENDVEIVVPPTTLIEKGLYFINRVFTIRFLDYDRVFKDIVEVKNVVINGSKTFFNILKMTHAIESVIHEEIELIEITVRAMDQIKRNDKRLQYASFIERKSVLTPMNDGESAIRFFTLFDLNDCNFEGDTIGVFVTSEPIKRPLEEEETEDE